MGRKKKNFKDTTSESFDSIKDEVQDMAEALNIPHVVEEIEMTEPKKTGKLTKFNPNGRFPNGLKPSRSSELINNDNLTEAKINSLINSNICTEDDFC